MIAAVPQRKKNPFPVRLACELQVVSPELNWHVHTLWTHQAVGLIAGAPKSAKTWFGLSLALSVASGTKAFGHFEVNQKGPALVYIAEDQEPMIRARIDALCQHHTLDINSLPLHVISVPAMRLDLEHDQLRLVDTVELVRPSIVLIDPLRRIHAADENNATDMARLLSFFRALQRSFNTAVIIVHHIIKRTTSRAGQSLRGSTDLWAWTDSCAYLSRKNDHDTQVTVTLEHRAAPAPQPLAMALISKPDESQTHLELLDPTPANPQHTTPRSLSERVLRLLSSSHKPLRRNAIRAQLRVNNSRLGQTLKTLEQTALIQRTEQGWCARSDTRSPISQLPLISS
jgi:hypothetical protein